MSHFLTEYMAYAAPCTDAPRVYHEFGAFSAMSAIMGRNVWVQRGHARIYPNIWAILLGDSTTARKTTCMNISKDLVREVDRGRIMADDFSMEAFLEALAMHPTSALYFSEFLSLAAKFQRDYTSGLKSALTEIYDCPPHPFSRILRKRGKAKMEVGESRVDEIIIPDVYLTILCGSTPRWFAERLHEDDFVGGLVPRFCLVIPKDDEIMDEMITLPNRDNQLREMLIGRLAWLTKVKGEMIIANVPAYEAQFRTFSAKYTPRHGHEDPLFSPYFSRLKDYALKYAMLYELGKEVIPQAGDTQEAPKIGPDSIEWGWMVVTDLAERAALVRSSIAFNPHEKIQQKIEAVLKGREKVQKQELLRRIRIPAFEMKNVLDTMVESEVIRTWKELGKELNLNGKEVHENGKEVESGNNCHRPATYFALTSKEGSLTSRKELKNGSVGI